MEKINEQNVNANERSATLDEELEQVSGGTGAYLKNECPVCGAVFRNSKDKKMHMRAMHPGDPRTKALR